MISRVIAAVLWLCLAAAAASAQPGFELPDLNEGLGPPPEQVDRRTPHATMEGLLDAVAAKDYDAAAHYLNLNDIPPAQQTTLGRIRAANLVEVLNRKVVIDWQDLPDRPDALDAQASSEAAMAGEPRRSILVDLLDAGRRPVEIRMNRVRPQGGDPVWVFSRHTVAAIPTLHALYGASTLERNLPQELRESAFWGLMWWEVLALPLAMALAGLLGWAVYRLFSLTARIAHGRLMTAITRAVRGPAILFTITATIDALTDSFFAFSGRIDSILSPLVALGFTAAALILVMNVIDAVLDRLLPFDETATRNPFAPGRRDLATRVAAGRRVLIIVIVLGGGALVIREAQLFSGYGLSLLASAGVLALILGFAARKILGNILSSLQIALNRSARIGDKLLFRDYLCHVERINFTFVQLRVWTGVRLIVPVEDFVGEVFENWTSNEEGMVRMIKLRLAHDADVAAMRQAFFDIVDARGDDPELGDPEGHMVMVTDHDVFGQEVSFCLACSNPDTAWQLSCEVREALLARATDMSRDGRPVFPDAAVAEAA